MKYLLFLLTLITGALLLSFALNHKDMATSREAEAGQISESARDKKIPVIVELFTSEGCSSCPPADEVLAGLDKTQPVTGVEIIALSEHVDYWNRLGWADPYSSAQYSERQSQYARAFGRGDIYTPQMVVDGQMEFVGSNMDKARSTIARSAKSPKANVQIATSPSQDGEKRDQVRLKVSVDNLPDVSEGDTAEVWLAVTENGLSSSVSRGENAGRKLAHSAVVRRLDSIGRITSRGAFSAEPTIEIARAWKRKDLRAVVFVQERESRRVLGGAALALADE
ncbi:MAG: DUF1223 domain-containing protein [Blastocatellia bacterium]|nr:DUF1223 domain-containing protein [Blastocatellia bacterium]